MAIEIQPISPVAIDLFGLEIRWYALAYILAFIVGFWVMRVLDKKNQNSPLTVPGDLVATKKLWDDLMVYVILGVILGGRLGYVLFYNLPFFLVHPLQIFAIWNGGMSFHGGMLGVIIGVLIYAYSKRYRDLTNPQSSLRNALSIMDMGAVVAPIGLFFGRIANFINMEVMGRITDKPWGVIFRGGEPVARHASPLYEAALEGILLFVIMLTLWKTTNLKKRPGVLSGVAAILYALFRTFCELFRQPDEHIGFLTSWGLTMGQLLSFGMIVGGLAIIIWSYRANKK